MKANIKKVCEFIEQVSIKGTIPTLVLNFIDDGLKVTVQGDNVVFCDGLLKKDIFKDYKSLGEFGIKNSTTFLNILKMYQNKEVELKVEDNNLILVSDTGSTYYTLCDKDMTDNFVEKELTLKDLDEGFNINVNKLKSIKSAGEILSVNSTEIEIKDNELTLLVTGDAGDKIIETEKIKYKDCKGIYGEYLSKIINCLSRTVNISLNDEYPIRLKSENEDFSTSFIIAPIIKNE
jgi:hypothetical protein